MVKIALLTCGAEWSGVYHEIEKAAQKVGGELIFPEVDLSYIDEVEDRLAELILEEKVVEGTNVRFDVVNGEILVEINP